MNNPSYAYSFRERNTKRKGVVYDIIFRVVDENGCEHQKVLSGYQTKTLAKQAYTEFMSTYVATPKKYDGKTKITYEYAFGQYINIMKTQMKESSIYDISHTFNKHIEPYFAGKNLAEVKKENVYQWQDSMWAKRKKNGQLYSVTRLIRVRNFFKTFVVWCSKRYGIKNFFDGIDAPKRKEQKREYIIWTKEDFYKFYKVIDSPKYKALFYTLFFCGCRIGELQALKPDDFDGKGIKISSTYTRKTLDDSSYKITATKNYKTHYVPLPAHSAEILKEWLDYKEKNNLENKYIFGGEHPISLSAIQFALDKGTKLAMLPKIRLHDFRHSYVSMLLSNGTNFAVIASLIGDTIQQTIKTYSHLIQNDMNNAIQML